MKIICMIMELHYLYMILLLYLNHIILYDLYIYTYDILYFVFYK